MLWALTVLWLGLGLQFAAGWQKYIPSLKPLGLNMLVNNTCLQPEKFLHLCDQNAYIDSRESRHPHDEHQQACVRSTMLHQPCLCKLAAEIGQSFSFTYVLLLFQACQHHSLRLVCATVHIGFSEDSVHHLSLRYQIHTIAPYHHSVDHIPHRKLLNFARMKLWSNV
jgi:hypothetical protein